MTCIWPLINTKITEISTLLASIVSIFKDVCNMFEPAWTGWLQIIMMRNPRVGHCTALRSDNDKIRAFWACQNLSIFGCTCVKTKTPGCIVQTKLNRSFLTLELNHTELIGIELKLWQSIYTMSSHISLKSL